MKTIHLSKITYLRKVLAKLLNPFQERSLQVFLRFTVNERVLMSLALRIYMYKYNQSISLGKICGIC